jgi:hypothetical protein
VNGSPKAGHTGVAIVDFIGTHLQQVDVVLNVKKFMNILNALRDLVVVGNGALI